MDQKTGTAAIVSIIAAIVSFVLIFSGHSVFGFILAIASVALGFIGLLMAASPRVSGGIISIVGIIVGSLGFLVAILGMLGAILF